MVRGNIFPSFLMVFRAGARTWQQRSDPAKTTTFIVCNVHGADSVQASYMHFIAWGPLRKPCLTRGASSALPVRLRRPFWTGFWLLLAVSWRTLGCSWRVPFRKPHCVVLCLSGSWCCSPLAHLCHVAKPSLCSFCLSGSWCCSPLAYPCHVGKPSLCSFVCLGPGAALLWPSL